jgi:lysophospholipase L1-like esterase
MEYSIVTWVHFLHETAWPKVAVFIIREQIMHAFIAAALATTLSTAPWQTTWFAAPQATWDSSFILPTNIPATLSGQTVREIVRTSVGGRHMRVQLSNRYGSAPLQIGAVRVARAAADGTAIEATSRALTFNGRTAVTVPPGAPVLSDPVELAVPPLTRLAVSTYLPGTVPLATFHWGTQQTAHIGTGDLTANARFVPAQALTGRLFLTGVLVDASPGAHTVIAFGDSITDGNGSTPGADRRWPDALAQRLADRGIAVVNAGISGARLLQDKMGANALARFGQDVLDQPGPKTVIVMLGINDIGWPGSPFAPKERAVQADDVIAGYQQLISLARLHHVRILGATLPPFEGALQGTPFEGHFSPAKERVRQEINRWIRQAGAFDAVIDADAVLRDPARPQRLLPAFDSGDHLHPGDAGYQALAAAIDLKQLVPH